MDLGDSPCTHYRRDGSADALNSRFAPSQASLRLGASRLHAPRSTDGSYLARTDGVCVNVIGLQSSAEVYKLDRALRSPFPTILARDDHQTTLCILCYGCQLPDSQLVAGMPGISTEEDLDGQPHRLASTRSNTVAIQIDRVMDTTRCRCADCYGPLVPLQGGAAAFC